MAPTRLDDLAPELVVDIARHLWLGDMSHMAQASRRLYEVLDPFLYHTDALPYNQYALYWAAEHNQTAVADKALRAGTPPSPGNGRPDLFTRPFGGTPQPTAPTSKQVREANAHRSLSTPLAIAASEGHVKIAAMLLRRTSAAMATTALMKHHEEDLSASLRAAAERGHGEMVIMLLQYAAATAQQTGGLDVQALVETAFRSAVLEGQPGVLGRMLVVRAGPAVVDTTSSYYSQGGQMVAAAAGYDDVWDLLQLHPAAQQRPTPPDVIRGLEGVKAKGPGLRGIVALVGQWISADGGSGDDDGPDMVINDPRVSTLLLSHACNRGNVPLMELLGQHLSDFPTVLRRFVRSGEFLRDCRSERVELVTTLLPHLQSVDADPETWSAGVAHALASGLTDTARVFLAAMPEGTVPLCFAQEPYWILAQACLGAHSGVVELLLLSMGIPIMQQGEGSTTASSRPVEDGWTLLQTTLARADRAEHRYRIAELLLEAGANPNERGSKGASHNTSPLMLACEAGLVDVALLLLHHGADALERNAAGYTPLHRACGYLAHDGRLVEALLDRGADVGARTLGKSTPLHELCLFRDRTGADFLERHAGGSVPASLTAPSARYTVAKLLLGRCGADPHAQNANGATALHFACTATDRPCGADDAAVVRALVEHGADLEQPNRARKTPLFLACSRLNLPVAAVLLELGADTSAAALRGFADDGSIEMEVHTPARDDTNRETMYYLVHGLAKLLLDYGADRAMLRATLLPVLNSHGRRNTYGRSYDTVAMLLMRAGGVDESTQLVLQREACAARTEALGKAMSLVVEDDEEEAKQGDDDTDDDDDHHGHGEAGNNDMLPLTVLSWPVPKKRNAPAFEDEEFLYY